MGEKQRDKKETILRILWPKQAGKTHTHAYIYTAIYVYVCARKSSPKRNNNNNNNQLARGAFDFICLQSALLCLA